VREGFARCVELEAVNREKFARMKQRKPRQHDEAHLSFIRSLPCLCCLDDTATEAAHIRFSDQRAAKVNPGVGQKPHDYWVVPLCWKCHREQHGGKEQEFWDRAMIDPLAVAAWLYLASSDHEAGETIIRAQH
jgi:hypothetical protein